MAANHGDVSTLAFRPCSAGSELDRAEYERRKRVCTQQELARLAGSPEFAAWVGGTQAASQRRRIGGGRALVAACLLVIVGVAVAAAMMPVSTGLASLAGGLHTSFSFRAGSSPIRSCPEPENVLGSVSSPLASEAAELRQALQEAEDRLAAAAEERRTDAAGAAQRESELRGELERAASEAAREGVKTKKQADKEKAELAAEVDRLRGHAAAMQGQLSAQRKRAETAEAALLSVADTAAARGNDPQEEEAQDDPEEQAGDGDGPSASLVLAVVGLIAVAASVLAAYQWSSSLQQQAVIRRQRILEDLAAAAPASEGVIRQLKQECSRLKAELRAVADERRQQSAQAGENGSTGMGEPKVTSLQELRERIVSSSKPGAAAAEAAASGKNEPVASSPCSASGIGAKAKPDVEAAAKRSPSPSFSEEDSSTPVGECSIGAEMEDAGEDDVEMEDDMDDACAVAAEPSRQCLSAPTCSDSSSSTGSTGTPPPDSIRAADLAPSRIPAPSTARAQALLPSMPSLKSHAIGNITPTGSGAISPRALQDAAAAASLLAAAETRSPKSAASSGASRASSPAALDSLGQGTNAASRIPSMPASTKVRDLVSSIESSNSPATTPRAASRPSKLQPPAALAKMKPASEATARPEE